MPASTPTHSTRYIGVMSGTSADAIDVVIVDSPAQQALTLLSSHSVPWPESLQQRILALGAGCANELDTAGHLDREIAQHFAHAVQETLARAGLTATDIRAIGSHGQTVRHRPTGPQAFSLQLGDPNTLAELTGISVVADFRRRDIAAGGQGAPLVPAFHDSLFADAGKTVVVVNLGGIANITVLQPGQAVTGYDTGPANMLMDGWCLRHQGLRYDRDGLWAASGKADTVLLQQLLGHPYFALSAPKSTGREDFGMAWLDHELAVYAEQTTTTLKPEDVQATLAALTVDSVRREITDKAGSGRVLVCGGGALNTHLMQLMQQALPSWQLASTADVGLDPLCVEACAFAWLARQTVLGLSGNRPAVTGASGERVLGGYYPAGPGLVLP